CYSLTSRDGARDPPCAIAEFCHVRTRGRSARDRLPRSFPLFLHHHRHRPAHGPEETRFGRLRARPPPDSMVGGARFPHRRRNQRRDIFRHTGRRLHPAELHLFTACPWHHHCPHSR